MYNKSKNCTNQGLLPEKVYCFKEELISEILTIPDNKPDMERVLDISVWPEVENIHLVETKVGTSNEGQHLTGLKLVVDIRFREKATYVACEPTQSVYAEQFECLKSIYVIVPKIINNTSIYNLMRSGRLQVIPYIEAVTFRMLDCRNIHKCIMLFVDVRD